MLFLKVFSKDAEKTRRALADKGLLDPSYEIMKEGEHVLFPLKEKVEGFGEIVEREGKKRAKPEQVELPPMDIIGSIAIVEGNREDAKKAAEWLLKWNKNIKTVLLKKSGMKGTFRVRELEFIAGENNTITIHKENGIRLMLDVSKVYFSPRLSSERARIASQVKEGENVAVLFAGVGPFSILIGKKCSSCSVISVELNPVAHQYAEKNIELNKTYNVRALNLDARELLAEEWRRWADRVVMPLPKDVVSFIDVAEHISKEKAMLHIYIFATSAEDAVAKLEGKFSRKWKVIKVRECGSYSRDVSRWVVDVLLD